MLDAVIPSGKPGRLCKFSMALFNRVVATIRDGAQTAPAIEREGIDHSTFYRHLQRRPELVPTLQAAQLERDRVRNVSRIEEAELELKRRGIDGWTEPIYDAKGEKVGDRPRYSDACLIFFLKHHKPEVYSESPKTAIIATQVNLTQERATEIMREWRQRLGAVESPAPVTQAPVAP